MSQENLDAFSRGTDAFNRRDFEAWLAELDPDVEWQSALPVLLTTGGGVYRGHEGLREMLRELDEALDELTVEYSEMGEQRPTARHSALLRCPARPGRYERPVHHDLRLQPAGERVRGQRHAPRDPGQRAATR
jgi:ketosteroid isomerase-like protein